MPKKTDSARIGIIGGSGLYQIDGISGVRQVVVATPFGKPSGIFTLGKLEGREVVFLPRHDVGHRIPPSHINYRANIFAMKKLGVERIVSVTACGSLRQELRPLDFVAVDQFVDRTNYARDMSFFEKMVVHISLAHPVCSELSAGLYASAQGLGLRAHSKGTYLNMEGPAFSTLAESNLYRSWGMDIIGMTNFIEAKLAREAEMCYATLAAITDYDCWHPSHDSVTVEMVMANLQKNSGNAKKILKKFIRNLARERTCACQHALQCAIVTDAKCIPAKVKKDLKIIIGKYIK